MRQPNIPDNEEQRLQALESLAIDYTPAEERFDRITRIAKRVFKAPIVLVSLVTQDKQWFKSRQGLAAAETSRDISFCGHAILSDAPFVVPNTMKDPDFKDNPLVTGPPGIRFYAGQPLLFEGFRIGTLCIIDTNPRQFRPAEYDSLKGLAHWVELELQDRHRSQNALMQQVLTPDHRETLIDPLTGNLNVEGVQLMQRKILEHDIQSRHFVLEFEMDSELGDKAEELRIALASALRILVDDTGTIGFSEPNQFDLFFVEQNDKSVEPMMEKIKAELDQFQASDELTWSWKIHEVESIKQG